MTEEKKKRSSSALRDVLFDEIEELRSGNGDIQRALAVANLAKQIVNTAKLELEFHREVRQHAEAGHNLQMGSMQLGSVPFVGSHTTAPPDPTIKGAVD